MTTRTRPAVRAGHGRTPNQSHASAVVTTAVTPVTITAPCAAGASTSPPYMMSVYGAPAATESAATRRQATAPAGR